MTTTQDWKERFEKFYIDHYGKEPYEPLAAFIATEIEWAREEQRESDARVCEKQREEYPFYNGHFNHDQTTSNINFAVKKCAAAIRANKQN